MHVVEFGEEEEERQEEHLVLSLVQHALEDAEDDRILAGRALLAIPDDLGKSLEAVAVDILEIFQDAVDVVPELLEVAAVGQAIDDVVSLPR